MSENNSTWSDAMFVWNWAMDCAIDSIQSSIFCRSSSRTLWAAKWNKVYMTSCSIYWNGVVIKTIYSNLQLNITMNDDKIWDATERCDEERQTWQNEEDLKCTMKLTKQIEFVFVYIFRIHWSPAKTECHKLKSILQTFVLNLESRLV